MTVHVYPSNQAPYVCFASVARTSGHHERLQKA